MDYNSGGYMENDGNNATSQNSNFEDRLPSTIRPVTIKQLLDATSSEPSANPSVDGEKVSRVKVVGVIRSVIETNSLRYTIEDGTGSMEFIYQSKRNDDSDMGLDDYGEKSDTYNLPKEIGIYVEVICLTRPGTERRMTYILSIHQIRDFNLVLYHYLAAIKAHLFFLKKNGLGGADYGNEHGSNDIFVPQGSSSGQERIELEITKYIFDHTSPGSNNGISLKPFLESTGGKEQEYRQALRLMSERGVLDDEDELYQFINPDENRDRLRVAGMI